MLQFTFGQEKEKLNFYVIYFPCYFAKEVNVGRNCFIRFRIELSCRKLFCELLKFYLNWSYSNYLCLLHYLYYYFCIITFVLHFKCFNASSAFLYGKKIYSIYKYIFTSMLQWRLRNYFLLNFRSFTNENMCYLTNQIPIYHELTLLLYKIDLRNIFKYLVGGM